MGRHRGEPNEDERFVVVIEVVVEVVVVAVAVAVVNRAIYASNCTPV